jgi:hypothetical protein
LAIQRRRTASRSGGPSRTQLIAHRSRGMRLTILRYRSRGTNRAEGRRQ